MPNTRAPAPRSTTPLTAPERETVILMSDADGVASITTYQRRIITKLQRAGARKVEDLTHGSQPGARFEILARQVSFRKASRPRANVASNLPHLRSKRT